MNIKNEIAVGIFFFIAIIILGYYTILMGEKIFESDDYYYMSVIFPDVHGLGLKDKVKVNGVSSGSVVDIQLKNNRVYVKLKMFNDFILFENYTIKIKNETTLGGKYVSISPGYNYFKGKTYAVIESRENLIGEPAGDVFEMLITLIGENRDNIFNTLKNIKEITGKINSGKGTLGKLINENQVHENADSLIKEIRDAMEDTREQAPVTSFIRAALTAF